MVWMRGACLVITSLVALTGAARFDESAALKSAPLTAWVAGQVLAQAAMNAADPSADDAADAPQSVAEFSAKKLKDPAALWIVTIAVASNLTGLEAGDFVEVLVFSKNPPEGAPDQGGAPDDRVARMPSAEEILRCLSTKNGPFAAEVTRDNVRIVIECVDRLGESRFYPMVGAARHHKQEFRCTVYSRKTTRADWPVPFRHVEDATETVHIDSDHLVAGDVKPVAENVQVVGVTSARPGQQSGDRLIVAVTPRQAIRLKAAKSSGLLVFVRQRGSK
jgi:hypothetical protein